MCQKICVQWIRNNVPSTLDRFIYFFRKCYQKNENPSLQLSYNKMKWMCRDKEEHFWSDVLFSPISRKEKTPKNK